MAIVLCIFAHPSLRVALGWEVREDVFAMPFVALAYLLLLRGQPIASAFSLLGACLCKEIFFITGVAFAVTIALHGARHSPHERRSHIAAAVTLFSVAAIGMSLYFSVLPHRLFWPTFDPRARVASLRQLIDPEMLEGKLMWLLKLSLPLLLLPGWSRASLPYLAPLAPAVLTVLVSNFEPMWQPMNYYSIQPAYLTALALLAGRASGNGAGSDLRRMALSLAISASLGAFTGTLPKIARDWPRIAEAAEVRAFVPRDARIAVTDYGAALFWNQAFVRRLFHAQVEKTRFDYVIISLDQGEAASPSFLRQFHECHRSPGWSILCANASPS
jgi:hypothetical protein